MSSIVSQSWLRDRAKSFYETSCREISEQEKEKKDKWKKSHFWQTDQRRDLIEERKYGNRVTFGRLIRKRTRERKENMEKEPHKTKESKIRPYRKKRQICKNEWGVRKDGHED